MTNAIRKSVLILVAAAAVSTLGAGCGTEISVVRRPVNQPQGGMKRVEVSVDLAGAGPGESAYVENVLIQIFKKSFPGSIMVQASAATTDKSPRDLRVVVSMLAPLTRNRWFTFLTFGFVKEHMYLGSVRLEDTRSGAVLDVYEVLARHGGRYPDLTQDEWADLANQLLAPIKLDLAGQIAAYPNLPRHGAINLARR